jgi:hypothetical protein
MHPIFTRKLPKYIPPTQIKTKYINLDCNEVGEILKSRPTNSGKEYHKTICVL